MTGDTTQQTRSDHSNTLKQNFSFWQLLRWFPVGMFVSLPIAPILTILPFKTGENLFVIAFLLSAIPACLKWITETTAVRLFCLIMGLFFGGMCWYGLYRVFFTNFLTNANSPQASMMDWVNAGALLAIFGMFVLSHTLLFIGMSFRHQTQNQPFSNNANEHSDISA